MIMRINKNTMKNGNAIIAVIKSLISFIPLHNSYSNANQPVLV